MAEPYQTAECTDFFFSKNSLYSNVEVSEAFRTLINNFNETDFKGENMSS
jgi:hypothetical protein